MKQSLRNWIGRHQNPVNFWLHMLGVPMTVLAVPLAIQAYWLIAAALFVAGYSLQFIGHGIEGNHSGEALLMRRLLGKGPDKSPDKPISRRKRPR